MGFFPYDNPQYSIAVVIQNGMNQSYAYGGVVSGPVFKEVADRIYASNISNEPMYQFQT